MVASFVIKVNNLNDVLMFNDSTATIPDRPLAYWVSNPIKLLISKFTAIPLLRRPPALAIGHEWALYTLVYEHNIHTCMVALVSNT